jgi:hypothetical protein
MHLILKNEQIIFKLLAGVGFGRNFLNFGGWRCLFFGRKLCSWEQQVSPKGSKFLSHCTVLNPERHYSASEQMHPDFINAQILHKRI